MDGGILKERASYRWAINYRIANMLRARSAGVFCWARDIKVIEWVYFVVMSWRIGLAWERGDSSSRTILPQLASHLRLGGLGEGDGWRRLHKWKSNIQFLQATRPEALASLWWVVKLVGCPTRISAAMSANIVGTVNPRTQCGQNHKCGSVFLKSILWNIGKSHDPFQHRSARRLRESCSPPAFPSDSRTFLWHGSRCCKYF